MGAQTFWFPVSWCFDSFRCACRADCASYLRTWRHLHLRVTTAVPLITSKQKQDPITSVEAEVDKKATQTGGTLFKCCV